MGKNNLFHKIMTGFQAARRCGRLYRVFGTDYFGALKQTLRLCREEGFTPEEVYTLDLTHPDDAPERLGQFLSKKKMMELQCRINPMSWFSVTEDKGIFYLFAREWGLPIPQIYALYFRKSSGWASPDIILSNKNDWLDFLERIVPEDFVIKPCRGVYGKKIRIFKRSKGMFEEPYGGNSKAEDIYNFMAGDREYNRFVIQERLINHAEIVRLTGNPFLQTVRISSLVDYENKCHLLHGSFRMILGNQVRDNFSGGSSRNLIAGVELETGRLLPATGLDLRGVLLYDIATHPASNMPITGFVLPFWKETRNMILEAAPKFLPIRTLGWDIGITETGPVIVEANMFWDPPNQSRKGQALLNKMKELGMTSKN
ncbi:hypothetical protein JW926_15210 [Candidatus Sumerlaeota bacterium]|nr:hypothetical protein [Candidatus Sumerlaeota bacterium]